MRRLIVLLAGTLACVQSLAQVFEIPKVTKWRIPEGRVTRVRSGDEVIWPTIPYITNGLVGMWDAQWNVGLGLHDNNTAIWKDLVGGRDMELSGTYHWTGNSCVIESVSGRGRGLLPSQELPESQTIQIVAYPTDMYVPPSRTNSWNTARLMYGTGENPDIYIYRNSNGGVCYFSWSAYESTGSTRAFADPGGTNAFTSYAPHQHTLSHEKDSLIVQYHVDGETKYVYAIANADIVLNGVTNAPLILANNTGYGYGVDASYYCMRIYDRVLSDKELAWNYMIDSLRYGLPKKWYPYMNSSWSWADFQDGNILFQDSSLDTRSEIGGPVLRIRNKGAFNRTAWYGHANMLRTEGGIRGRYISGTISTQNMLRANVNMFTATNDWNNIEFASILVTSNELASAPFTQTCYMLRPSLWRGIMIFFSGGTPYYRSMQTNNSSIKIQGLTQAQIRSVDPMILSVRVKSVDGVANTIICINGTEILNETHTMPDGVAGSFQPAVMYSSSYSIMTRDYCENLWWDHIPEDWDMIEKTLMLKYDAKPLTYYVPNYGKPLLGGGFGGGMDEPEEPED